MDKPGKKKIIIICSAIILVAAVAITAFVLLSGKKEEYRIIKVYEVDGDATVIRGDIGEIAAYKDMVLESGDVVNLKSGTMTLKLDDDKYVYVEPETEFKLIASGSSKNSKTSIELSYGAITNEIQNPLSDKSSYEINTPNSNMAVRGTIYRVYTYLENGITYTKVSVFEGKVDSKLKYSDDSLSEDTVLITNGNEVLIYEDEETTDYVGPQHEISFEELPENVIRLLINIVENGNDIGVSSDELNSYLNNNDDNNTVDELSGPFTVTFVYNGEVFGTQVVEKGETATRPKLVPSLSGDWDFDFSQKIYSDTTIDWR